MIYKIYFMVVAVVIIVNFIKPFYVWLSDKHWFRPVADANSMYKVTKVFIKEKVKYQLWYSNNRGKTWYKLGCYCNSHDAMDARNGHIEHNSVVEGSFYDPSHLLKEGEA